MDITGVGYFYFKCMLDTILSDKIKTCNEGEVFTLTDSDIEKKKIVKRVKAGMYLHRLIF